MGKAHAPPLTEKQCKFLQEQRIFFTGTCADVSNSRVNVSPKSAAQFRVVGDGNAIAYLDFTGSGTETSAHLEASKGRITIMFCAFVGAPQILRLFGKGSIIPKQNCDGNLLGLFEEKDIQDVGFRAIVYVDLKRISHSCGYSVPLFDYVQERNVLREVTEKMGPDQMEQYHYKKNFLSIDYLPGMYFWEKNLHPKQIIEEEGFPMAYFYDSKSITLFQRMYSLFFLRGRVLYHYWLEKSSSWVAFFKGLLIGLLFPSLVRWYKTINK